MPALRAGRQEQPRCSAGAQRDRTSAVQAPVPEYPASLLPSLRNVQFVCPLCRGALEIVNESYFCDPCEKAYPLMAGIPDFRVFSDPYLTFEEDRARTEIVLSALDRYELEPLLEYYWTFSDITPLALRTRFVRSAMLGEQRALRMVSLLESRITEKEMAVARVLEIGSGTGNFLAAASGCYRQVVGIDIAMRWLHVSRRRFMDKGMPVPPLVCCCAEYLPFADNTFDLIVAHSTLEFTRDQHKFMSECARTSDSNGLVYINTVNRFSLARDPYAYLWGVGFLPRSWQARYVRWRREARYEQIRLLSLGELDRMAKGRFEVREFLLPDVDDAALARFSTLVRSQVRLYRLLKRLPGVQGMLRRLGPGWDALLSKPAAPNSASERSNNEAVVPDVQHVSPLLPHDTGL